MKPVFTLHPDIRWLKQSDNTGAFTASNVAIDTTSTAYAEGRISLVACGATGPATSDLAPVGLFYNVYSFGGGGGGGGSSGPYLRMELSGAMLSGSNYATTYGQCYPLSLNL